MRFACIVDVDDALIELVTPENLLGYAIRSGWRIARQTVLHNHLRAGGFGRSLSIPTHNKNADWLVCIQQAIQHLSYTMDNSPHEIVREIVGPAMGGPLESLSWVFREISELIKASLEDEFSVTIDGYRVLSFYAVVEGMKLTLRRYSSCKVIEEISAEIVRPTFIELVADAAETLTMCGVFSHPSPLISYDRTQWEELSVPGEYSLALCFLRT